MSRTGKKPIAIPSGVKANIAGRTITVEGPKGRLERTFRPEVEVAVQENEIIVTVGSTNRQARAFHGLTRALLANMVRGVSLGFTRELDVSGVGYRANVQGKTISLSLGFTHEISHPIPDGVEVSIDKVNKITITGPDNQKVGQLAAELRSYRPSDPYKLKGIKYHDEVIKKKVGKAGAK